MDNFKKGGIAILAAIITAISAWYFSVEKLNLGEGISALVCVVAFILGVYKNIRFGTFNIKAFGQIIPKLITYSSLLISVHLLSQFEIEGVKQETFSWLTIIAYTSLMIVEASSIFDHTHCIYPTFLTRSIKLFFDNLKKKQQEKFKQYE